MKTHNIVALAAIVTTILAALPAIAQPVVAVEGVVARGGVRVTDVFTATIEVLADTGDVLVTSSVPSLSVEDGFFSVEVDLADATADLRDGQVLTVTVDLGNGLESTTRLGSIWRVASASGAERAVVAVVAERLGDIPAADLVADVSPLTVPLAFANLSALPAGIADGVDNGTIDTLTGLAIAGGTLNVATGGVTDIVTGTLTGAQLRDDTVTSTQLGSLTAAKVADGTLTGANFASAGFLNADVTGTALVFKNPAGCANPFQLTATTSTPLCERVVCGTDRRTACTSFACEDVGPDPSPSVRFCIGTNEGFMFLGRLIKDPVP